MNNDEQKRFKATTPKVSDVQAFKQILERALTPHATNSLDRFNELKAFVQGPVTRLNGFPITTNPLQATRLAKLDPEIEKIFDCMVSSPEIFRGYSTLPLKTVVDALVGVAPEDYRKALKKAFPKRKSKKQKHKRKKRLTVTDSVNYITLLIFLCQLLGVPPEEINLPHLLQVCYEQVQKKVNHESESKAVDGEFRDGGEFRAEKNQPETNGDGNEPHGNHDKTSTLI